MPTTTPDEEDLAYEAIDRYIHAVLRWERHPGRLCAADVANAAGQVLLALEQGERAYGAFSRLYEEWLVAAAEWVD